MHPNQPAAGKRLPFVPKIVEIAGFSALYLVLAALVLKPAFQHFSQGMIGSGDSAQNLWNLWWVGQSLNAGEWFPFQTNFLYHPSGVSLAFHPLAPLNGWLAYLIQHLFRINLYAAYNLLTVLSFLLTGLACSWLVRSLTGNRGAAVAASIIFTFAPVRMSRVFFGNLEMYSTQWVPLCILFLLKMKQSQKWVHAAAAAVFFALTVATSLYISLGAALFCGLLLLWELWGNRHSRAAIKITLRNWTIFAAILVVLSLPVVLPMIQDYADFQNQADTTAASTANSADILGFVVPDTINAPLLQKIPVVKRLIQSINSRYAGNLAEKTVFAGWSVMLLSLLPFITRRGKAFSLWGAAAFLFFLLCLGPIPHFLGREISIPLFYSLINKVPLIGFGRAPSRLALFLMLALAVWVGGGLSSLVEKYPRLAFAPWLAAAVIFLEFSPIPVRVDLRPLQIPAYYDQIALDPDVQHAVLDIPIDLYGAQGPAGDYMLYQTVHQKPIVSGYISRTPQKVMRLVESDFLGSLHAHLYGNQSPFAFDPNAISRGMEELCGLKVEYIILHRSFIAESDAQTLLEGLTQVLKAPVYEDQSTTVWRMSRIPQACAGRDE